MVTGLLFVVQLRCCENLFSPHLSLSTSMASTSSQSPETPPLPDVHSLVAFAASYFSESAGISPSAHYNRYQEDKPCLLDSIAAICATPAHPQPVAVAVTIDHMNRQVRLLLSQTGVETPDRCLLPHLLKTWGLLRELWENNGKLQPPSAWRRPVKNPAQMVNVNRLFRYIYESQSVEVLRIFRESWPKLDSASRQLGRSRRHKSKPDELKAHFLDAALALRKVVRIMGEDLSVLTTERWEQLLSLMEIATDHANIVLHGWVLCEFWGINFNGMR